MTVPFFSSPAHSSHTNARHIFPSTPGIYTNEWKVLEFYEAKISVVSAKLPCTTHLHFSRRGYLRSRRRLSPHPRYYNTCFLIRANPFRNSQWPTVSSTMPPNQHYFNKRSSAAWILSPNYYFVIFLFSQLELISPHACTAMDGLIIYTCDATWCRWCSSSEPHGLSWTRSN
jgi:hypothetical protein